MVWYKDLGFHNNPLSIKPGAFHTRVIGYDLSEVLDKVEKGQVLFLEGEYGFGKTTILKHIVNKYRGRRELIYYNCNRAEKTIAVETLLKGKYGLLGRVVNKLPRNMILLLDEIEKMSVEDQRDLHKFYTQGNIRSVVFFGPSFEKSRFTIELQKLMVDNVIQLTPLTEREVVELVRQRVGNLKLVSDKLIREVYRHSNKNPRVLLENLEDLCRYAYDNNEDEVTEEHVKQLLKIKEHKRKPRKRAKKPKKKAEKPQLETKNIGESSEPENLTQEEPDSEEYFYY